MPDRYPRRYALGAATATAVTTADTQLLRAPPRATSAKASGQSPDRLDTGPDSAQVISLRALVERNSTSSTTNSPNELRTGPEW
jgi:hypothetical protein